MGFWSYLAMTAPGTVPVLLVYVAGIVLAVLQARVSRRASMLMLSGLLLICIGMLGGVLVNAFVFGFHEHSITSMRPLLTASTIITNGLSIAGIALVIASFLSAIMHGIKGGDRETLEAFRATRARQAFVLGILGVVLLSPFGILAWAMASDMRDTDPSTPGDAKVLRRIRIARILGIIATVFYALEITAFTIITLANS